MYICNIPQEQQFHTNSDNCNTFGPSFKLHTHAITDKVDFSYNYYWHYFGTHTYRWSPRNKLQHLQVIKAATLTPFNGACMDARA